jgi:hypothetical protein
LIGYCIPHDRITYLYFIDEAMADKKAKVFLYLSIAHVGAIHDLGLASPILAGSILANFEHIAHYLYIGSPVVHFDTISALITLIA